MRLSLALALFAIASSLAACSSEPLTGDTTGGGSNAGGKQSMEPRPCSGALKQSLSLVDEVSTATVATLDEVGSERTLYVDASAGGIDGQDQHPWVYLSLATGKAVAVSDLDALSQTSWDLAFKRFLVRTNSGDSGPGQGGAIRIALPWDQVESATLGSKAVPVEEWFDADCMLQVDMATMELITTFSGWSEYDDVNHVLSAADVVFIVKSAAGELYKLQILDYYSTPTGSRGNIAGRYKLRVAPL
jgi:hypothetical protein